MYTLPDEFAPLPRILHGPFHGKPTLDMLLEDFKHMTSQDHNPNFRALAISVSCSLFAPGSEAPPLSCFSQGYSCSDLSFRGLLTGLLRTCGVHDPDYLADKIVEVGEKYRLPASPYKATGATGMFPFLPTGMLSAPPSINRDEESLGGGSMLQIFIHKDTVDSLAYASYPMGVPIPGVPSLAEHLKDGHTEGQARIFMHPAVFTDTTKAHLYHYSASPLLSAMDSSVPLSRGAFIKDLRKTLEPILGDYAALRKAFHAVEGRP